MGHALRRPFGTNTTMQRRKLIPRCKDGCSRLLCTLGGLLEHVVMFNLLVLYLLELTGCAAILYLVTLLAARVLSWWHPQCDGQSTVTGGLQQLPCTVPAAVQMQLMEAGHYKSVPAHHIQLTACAGCQCTGCHVHILHNQCGQGMTQHKQLKRTLTCWSCIQQACQ